MKSTLDLSHNAVIQLFFILLLSFYPFLTPAQGITGKPLFVSGQNGYHTYRIPALAVTT